MILSEFDKQKYIQEVVINNYQHMLDTDNYFGIYDSSGSLVAVTKTAASGAGFDPKEMIGMNYINPPQSFIDMVTKQYRIIPEATLSALNKIGNLIQKSVKQKQLVGYLDMIPEVNQFTVFYVTFMPIFHPNGEVIAVLGLGVKHFLFGMQDLLESHVQEKIPLVVSFSPPKDNFIKLTNRQHEVLFLISNGFTEEYAARILGVKRTTINSILREHVMPKFGTKYRDELVKIAVDISYHKIIPQTLLKWNVVALDD